MDWYDQLKVGPRHVKSGYFQQSLAPIFYRKFYFFGWNVGTILWITLDQTSSDALGMSNLSLYLFSLEPTFIDPNHWMDSPPMWADVPKYHFGQSAFIVWLKKHCFDPVPSITKGPFISWNWIPRNSKTRISKSS